MDFLKKNWAKIVLATLAFLSFIFMMVPLFTTPKFKFVGAMQIVGPVLFFAGLTAYYILKMFDKTKFASLITIISAASLALILMFIGLFGFNSGFYKTPKKDGTVTKGEGVLGGIYSSSYQAVGSEAYYGGSDAADTSSIPEWFGDLGTTASAASLAKMQTNGAKISARIAKADAKVQKGKMSGAQYTRVLKKELGNMRKEVSKLKAADGKAAEFKVAKKAALKGIDAQIDQIKTAETVANTALFTYLTMILMLGVAPIVYGTKKLLCKCGSTTKAVA